MIESLKEQGKPLVLKCHEFTLGGDGERPSVFAGEEKVTIELDLATLSDDMFG
jgi:hypothetical protein